VKPELNVGRLAGRVLLEVKVSLPDGTMHTFMHHLVPDDARKLALLLDHEAETVDGRKAHR